MRGGVADLGWTSLGGREGASVKTGGVVEWGYVAVVVELKDERVSEAVVAVRRTAVAAGAVLGEVVGQFAGRMVWACVRASRLLMVWAVEAGLERMLLGSRRVAVQLQRGRRSLTCC